MLYLGKTLGIVAAFVFVFGAATQPSLRVADCGDREVPPEPRRGPTRILITDPFTFIKPLNSGRVADDLSAEFVNGANYANGAVTNPRGITYRETRPFMSDRWWASARVDFIWRLEGQGYTSWYAYNEIGPDSRYARLDFYEMGLNSLNTDTLSVSSPYSIDEYIEKGSSWSGYTEDGASLAWDLEAVYSLVERLGEGDFQAYAEYAFPGSSPSMLSAENLSDRLSDPMERQRVTSLVQSKLGLAPQEAGDILEKALQEYSSVQQGQQADSTELSRATTEVYETPRQIGSTEASVYPTPFRGETTIEYVVDEPGDVQVSIYSSVGQRVKQLFSGKQSIGSHFLRWDATGEGGVVLSSGVYFIKIKTPQGETTETVVLIR